MQIGNQTFINTNISTGERHPGSPGIEKWRRAIKAAIASVMDGVTEGLALHATTLHPQIFWSLLDHGEVDSIQPDRQTQNRHLMAFPQRREAMTVSSFELHESTRWVSSRSDPERDPGHKSARPISLSGRLWSWLFDSYEHRRAVRALEALDDRTLKDMGISRYEIGHLVRHGRPWN